MDEPLAQLLGLYLQDKARLWTPLASPCSVPGISGKARGVWEETVPRLRVRRRGTTRRDLCHWRVRGQGPFGGRRDPRYARDSH